MSYIPHTDDERKQMLESIGVSSIEELFSDIPAQAKLAFDLDLPPALSEWEILEKMKKIAARNKSQEFSSFFLGAGSYRHYIPAVVEAITSRSEFYTAYTPYQPEVSQGTLQVIYEFQTLICQLTGMDLANASMYEGASAVAEAAYMAIGAKGRKKILVSRALHPEYREVLKTYLATGRKVDIREITCVDGVTDVKDLYVKIDEDVAAVIIQNPNFFGCIEDLQSIKNILVDKNIVFVVVITEPVSLGILKNPGSCGADIVAGEGASFGLGMSMGGPYLGFLAAREEFMRRMPGRLSGKTVDSEGRRGFVLTLQAREQHIRREKALSNICTNEALCALAASIYLCYMGREGLREVALSSLLKAHYLQEKLKSLKGFELPFSSPFFNEFVVKCPVSPARMNRDLLEHGITGGYELGKKYPELDGFMLLCVTEITKKEQMDEFINLAGRYTLQ